MSIKQVFIIRITRLQGGRIFIPGRSPIEQLLGTSGTSLRGQGLVHPLTIRHALPPNSVLFHERRHHDNHYSDLVAGPLCNFQRCSHVVFWIWLHLLHFNVANQIIDPQEDGKNKSSRPIPAGLISTEDATVLRWALIPICLVISACYSSQVFGLSFVLTLFIIFYNELKAHEHWISKNFITAVGYACFEIGSTLIAGKDMSRLEPTAISAICLSLAVFTSTLHAQDFKDVEGDRLIGRQTLPIAFPNLARTSMLVALPLWSICLSRIWEVNTLCTLAFTGYAAMVGLRFMTCKTSQAARMSCKLYSVSGVL
ncbi:UbiA prenyltransferase family-domain-containing protein [Suillus placidus]|uniref:UbiA prenyltransferase family-domain-containing protein n=1 Tax=Suillus placidus TaxID=48579 RepID=A0A9P7A2H6_9AGAM|nr:UbiA prenyltransferase family-domain-containing protein [Suillus placidus]